MADRLTRFLIELSKDPLKREQFDGDPEGAMTTAGLNPTERRLVLERDAAQVRAHYGVRTLAHMTCEDPNDATCRTAPKKKKKAKKVAKKATKPAKKPAKKKGGR